jgi:hypothetical protein
MFDSWKNQKVPVSAVRGRAWPIPEEGWEVCQVAVTLNRPRLRRSSVAGSQAFW